MSSHDQQSSDGDRKYPTDVEALQEDLRDAILRRVGRHFRECRGLAVDRAGYTLNFAGRLAFAVDQAQAHPQGMVVDYSMTVAGYPERVIRQPVSFPGIGRERQFEYCVQMLTDGVLAPALQSVGFDLPGDHVLVGTGTSFVEGQGPVEWDVFRGYTLIYSDQPDAVSLLSKTLNDEDKLFQPVFGNAAGLMAHATIHWWKIFYCRVSGRLVGDAWLDDYRIDEIFQATCALDIPPARYLMFRQFGIFRPANRERQDGPMPVPGQLPFGIP